MLGSIQVQEVAEMMVHVHHCKRNTFFLRRIILPTNLFKIFDSTKGLQSMPKLIEIPPTPPPPPPLLNVNLFQWDVVSMDCYEFPQQGGLIVFQQIWHGYGYTLQDAVKPCSEWLALEIAKWLHNYSETPNHIKGYDQPASNFMKIVGLSMITSQWPPSIGSKSRDENFSTSLTLKGNYQKTKNTVVYWSVLDSTVCMS